MIADRSSILRDFLRGLEFIHLAWGLVDHGLTGLHRVIDAIVSGDSFLDRARGLPAILDRLECAKRPSLSQWYKGLASRARR